MSSQLLRQPTMVAMGTKFETKNSPFSKV